VTDYSLFRDKQGAEPVDFGSPFFLSVTAEMTKIFEAKGHGFMDIDVLTEKNGFGLIIECKHPLVEEDQKGLKAQRIAIERMTRRFWGLVGYVVWSDKAFEEVKCYRRCFNGIWGEAVHEKAGEELRSSLIAWANWVAAQKQPYWETKW